MFITVLMIWIIFHAIFGTNCKEHHEEWNNGQCKRCGEKLKFINYAQGDSNCHYCYQCPNCEKIETFHFNPSDLY